MSKGGKACMRRAYIAHARTAVCLAVFLSVGIGLAFNTGWGTLSSMGVGAIATICPLGALETLLAGYVPLPRFLIALAVALVAVALAGRFFCSWICPVPAISRFFHPKAKSIQGARRGADEPAAAAAQGGKPLPPIGGRRDGLQVDTRHFVLVGTLISAAVFGFPVFCLICPVGLTFATFIAVWNAFAQQDPSWSLVVFPLILAIELALLRSWCSKLCPLGALMSLLSQRAPLFKPTVDARSCMRAKGTDCHACINACPEQLDPHAPHIPECTKCGICVSACPTRAISMPLLHRDAGSLSKNENGESSAREG